MLRAARVEQREVARGDWRCETGDARFVRRVRVALASVVAAVVIVRRLVARAARSTLEAATLR